MSDGGALGMFNAGSPFSEVKLYVGRENKGFFCHPKSDTADSGWGKPFYDESGNPIIPGTPGGEGTRRFIGKNKEGNTYCRRNPGTQMYGNISWLGPIKDTAKPQKGRWVLTYHGPSTRYFPEDAFSYGSEDRHNNVYCEGLCVAVAPLPVLGAALKPTYDEDGKRMITIFVICYGGADLVYKKTVYPSMGVTMDGYGDDFRNESMKMYSEDNPRGWVFLGSMSCKESSQGSSRSVKNAKTPWFFDESASQAQCMREVEITFNRGDKDVTQYGYARYKATITDYSASVTAMDNTSGFTFHVTGGVEQKEDLVRNTKYPYYTTKPIAIHSWRTHKAWFMIEASGEYVIAVDYKGTEEKLLKVVLKGVVKGEQWFYKGIDGAGDDNYVSNGGKFGGDFYPRYLDPDLVAEPGGGEWGCWVKDDVVLKLEGGGIKDYFWLYRRLSGSETEFRTGQPATTQEYLYFHFDSQVYLHYLAMPRHQVSLYQDQRLHQNDDLFRTEAESYSEDGSENPISMYTIMEKSHAKVEGTHGYFPGTTIGWFDWTQLEAYWLGGVSYDFNITSFDAKYPEDYNFSVSQNNPKDFFYGFVFDLTTHWKPLKDLLQTAEKNTREGSHVQDCFDNFAASFKYKDENGNDRYCNIMNGSDDGLTSYTKAEGDGIRHYEMGES